MTINVLLADISNARGGVENTIQTILADAAKRPGITMSALVTPSPDNQGFIEYCRSHATTCFEEAALASIIFGPLKAPIPTGSTVSAHRAAPGRRFSPKKFFVKQARKLLPPGFHTYWWHRSLTRRAAPIIQEVLDRSHPDILHCRAGMYTWFAPAVFARGHQKSPRIIFHLGCEPVLGELPSFAVRLWRRADFMIYVSNPIKHAWEQKYPLLASMPNRVIHHGVDMERFTCLDRSARIFTPEQPFRIGVCGRLSGAKGIDIAIQAFAKIIGKIPHARLEIVGDGPDRPHLVQLVRETGLAEWVVFHGHRENVLPFLHQFDLFIQPSRNEAFGISNVEAMATGLPVIGSRAGGIPDIVVHNGIGRLVDIGDIAGFAREIIDLYQNPELRHRYGLAGRQRAESLFSQKRMCDEIHEVYRQVLNS